MRLFISINIPEELKKNIFAFIEDFKKKLPNLGWVKLDNIHITLKFLGASPPEDIDEIKAALKSVAGKFGKTKIKIENIGCFPSESRPRVLWAGISEGSGFLKEVAKSLDEKLAKKYNVEKREFVSHITMARIKSYDGRGSKKIKKAIADKKNTLFGEFMVGKISLMQSFLSPKGAIHEEVCSFEFLL